MEPVIIVIGGIFLIILCIIFYTRTRDKPTPPQITALPELQPPLRSYPPQSAAPQSAPISYRSYDTAPIPMPRLSDLLAFLERVESRGHMASDRQMTSLRRMGFDTEGASLTLDQASAIFSARAYAESVMHVLIKQTNGYPFEKAVAANLAAFIVRDDVLRVRTIAWDQRRYARGTDGVPRLRRDEHFKRVIAEAERLYRMTLSA